MAGKFFVVGSLNKEEYTRLIDNEIDLGVEASLTIKQSLGFDSKEIVRVVQSDSRTFEEFLSQFVSQCGV